METTQTGDGSYSDGWGTQDGTWSWGDDDLTSDGDFWRSLANAGRTVWGWFGGADKSMCEDAARQILGTVERILSVPQAREELRRVIDVDYPGGYGAGKDAEYFFARPIQLAFVVAGAYGSSCDYSDAEWAVAEVAIRWGRTLGETIEPPQTGSGSGTGGGGGGGFSAPGIGGTIAGFPVWLVAGLVVALLLGKKP